MRHASVAQWIERGPSNPEVAGSSPVGGADGCVGVPKRVGRLLVAEENVPALLVPRIDEDADRLDRTVL